MLIYNGNLLVKAAGRTWASLVEGRERLRLRAYELEPLFEAYRATKALADDMKGDHWFLAKREAPLEENPWDIAHREAERPSGHRLASRSRGPSAIGWNFYDERRLDHGREPRGCHGTATLAVLAARKSTWYSASETFEALRRPNGLRIASSHLFDRLTMASAA